MQSVLVVHAQRLLPVRQGFAAGLILGFTCASSALGIWLGGIATDIWGLTPVMQALTLLALAAAALSLALRGRPHPYYAIPHLAHEKAPHTV